MFATLQCLAEYSVDMPGTFRDLILQAASSDAALDLLTRALAKISLFKSLIGTTQGIDVIKGGIKVNALPEQASAIVNHRIAVFRFALWLWTREPLVLKPVVRAAP